MQQRLFDAAEGQAGARNLGKDVGKITI